MLTFSVDPNRYFAGIFEKVGVEPQVQRIGKYKSAGDQLSRKNMSSENSEMLTALLDNIYRNWLERVSATKGTLVLFNGQLDTW